MKQIAVFASGTGSNFLAILEAIASKTLEVECAILVSDKPNSLVVQRAKAHNIPTLVINPKGFANKNEYETVILKELQQHSIDLIVLAGYMRMIGPTLLHAFPRKIINIHPSLLPAFKGLDAVGQAMSAGVRETGVTIHYVDDGMDTGEVIAQEALDISQFTTREDIESHIHAIEHKLYPRIIRDVLKEEDV